jgi:uncharacterized membrane protein YqiK
MIPLIVGITLLLVITAIYTFITAIPINDDEVGIVYKKYTVRQSRVQPSLPASRLIALYGEAGCQADLLGPGLHPGFWPWLYKIQKVPLIQVQQGEIALVVATDGAALPPGRQLGRSVDCNNFQDARAFLVNGGQRGRQLEILTAGEYRINTALFDVITTVNAKAHDIDPALLQVYTVEAGNIGIVTVYDANLIPTDGIAGPHVAGHNNFQDGQIFIDRGGCKGLQEEILPAGAYHLNPWFVRVKQVPLTLIPIGTVGVVISHVGKILDSHTDDKLVDRGYKGIWRKPLEPNKHAINVDVMDVAIVPTHEITLDWSNKAKPASNYDSQLHALRLRSKDGFDFNIEVTQVISIKGDDAPQMISRIGVTKTEGVELSADNTYSSTKYSSIRNLVTRVLEPMIGNYFRNSAQDSGVLDFLEDRSNCQKKAAMHIRTALSAYGVQASGTFINEIDLPNELEDVLKRRKLAEEELKTIAKKQQEEEQRQGLVRSQAITAMQPELVKAELSAQIARDEYEAQQLKIYLKADEIRQVGEAQADALRNKAEALDGVPNLLDQERIRAASNIRLPSVWVSDSSQLPNALMAPLLGTPTNQGHPLAQIDNHQLLQILSVQKSGSAEMAFVRLQQLIGNPNPNPSEVQELITMLKPLGLIPQISEVSAEDRKELGR